MPSDTLKSQMARTSSPTNPPARIKQGARTRSGDGTKPTAHTKQTDRTSSQGTKPAAANGAAADSAYALTVEQLAAEVGMSVRNIRNHHTRGLLPPPEVRARVGYYSAEHVARLRLILDLQADGFNLAAIERLLSGSHGLAERLLGLRRARHHSVRGRVARDHHRRGAGRAVRRRRRAGHRARPQAEAARAARRRTLRSSQPGAARSRRAGGRARHPAARRARARREGQPRLRIDLTRVHASCSCASCGSRSTRPGQPDDGWDELIAGVTPLRPLASEALLALFKQRMTAQLEEAFGKVLEHQAKRK